MAIDPAKSIPAFYAGQSIFLTGATGFLGKVFIEKVLRSCPEIREIFLLMRPKKGINIDERLEKILNLPLFEKLRDEQPTIFRKLVPIFGDIREKELGLSAADKQMLIERVTIIIHGAASVRFNISLKYAIFSIIRATRDICILAQSMKNLKALVYIGTAFAHTNESFIEEKTYPPITNWQKMIKIAESMDEHILNIFTTKCLDYLPNTYIFSKNLAESVIQEYSSSLPCAIVRPSFVCPSLKDPIVGWIDNIYGPIGLTIGAGKGLLRVALCNEFVSEDIVPVDIVINAIIVVSWKLGLITFTGSTPFVLNCTNQKYVTYNDIYKKLLSISDEVCLEEIIWPNVNIIFTTNFTLFYILTILLHILPAILIDLILYSFGRKPALVQLQRQVYVISRVVNYFSFHEWKFSNTNTFALLSSLPSDNRDMFSFEFSCIDIKEYMKNCAIGAKKFILHEDLNRMDAAKAHRERLRLFVTIVKIIIYTSVLWIMYKWICSYIL